jgi:hypothetical protein
VKNSFWGAFAPDNEEVRRGPKSKHRGEDFMRFRDCMVDMLESYWPEIEPSCVPVVRAAALRDVLKAIAQTVGSQHRICIERLLRNFRVLVEFLGTDRFRGDPRQVANALAGVPEIGYWRSLRLGQAEPCRGRIGQRALKAYIRRRHPTLYDKLEEEIELVHFANVWRTYRSKDANLRIYHAKAILHAWMVAEPITVDLKGE